MRSHIYYDTLRENQCASLCLVCAYVCMSAPHAAAIHPQWDIQPILIDKPHNRLYICECARKKNIYAKNKTTTKQKELLR